MKKTFLIVLLLMTVVLPVQARYKCEVNSATNEVVYSATKMKDNFSKADMIEFGKSVKKDNIANYYVVPAFMGKSLGSFFLSDEGKIIIDGLTYSIFKDTTASHIRMRPDKSTLLAEYCVPNDIADKIKTSKGKIVFLFTIEGRDEKVLDFGLKTSDEIRFVANRNFEDFRAGAKKQLVPKYTETDQH